MRHLITVFAIAAMSVTGMAYAQDDAASAPKSKRVRTLTPAQKAQEDCTGQAEAKPREERQQFIKDCVAGTPAPEKAAKTKPHRVRTLTAEQKKNSDCSAQAAGMARDERVEFVKKCQAGESTADAAPGPKMKAQRVKTLTPEQQKANDCAAQAAAKPRDERVAFVKECTGK